MANTYLTAEEYKEKYLKELQEAEDWITKMCEGFEEIIICSDHYPFGVDCPICLWIQQKPEGNSYRIYDVDWDLFDVSFLPIPVASNEYLASKSDGFFIKEMKNKYGWNVAEVEPFEYVKKKFEDDSYVYEGDSIHDLLDNSFSYLEDEYTYEKYLEECNEEGCNIERGKAVYEVGEFSRTTKDNDDFNGRFYINLYLVARR